MITLDSIRVGSRVEIGVNDNGDTIVLNFDDCSFIDNFFQIAESLDKASEYFNGSFEQLEDREKICGTREKMQEISEEIDRLFGEGCCKKVFGNIVPSPYLVAEFFEQLLPIIQKHADERQKKIAAKYSKSRKGSRSAEKKE